MDVDGSTVFQAIDNDFQSTIRPDLVIFDASKVAVLELTICHESNILKSRSYKINKYSDCKLYLNSEFRNHKIELFTLEVSVLASFQICLTFVASPSSLVCQSTLNSTS